MGQAATNKQGHMGYLVFVSAVMWVKAKELPYTSWWKVKQEVVFESLTHRMNFIVLWWVVRILHTFPPFRFLVV